jgi:hypothetical protein
MFRNAEVLTSRCTLAYRSALVRSKKAIIALKGLRSRYELDTTRIGENETAKASEPIQGTGFAGADDEVQTRTNEVTDALKRTTQVMQAELERSVLSVRMLGTLHLLSHVWSGLKSTSYRRARHHEIRRAPACSA